MEATKTVNKATRLLLSNPEDLNVVNEASSDADKVVQDARKVMNAAAQALDHALARFDSEAAELYEQIGRLKVELEWFKKSGRELVSSH